MRSKRNDLAKVLRDWRIGQRAKRWRSVTEGTGRLRNCELLRKVDGHWRVAAGFDRRADLAFAELRVLENELAQPEWDRGCRERRVPGLLAVEPDFGPRKGVEVHRSPRVDADGLHLAGLDVDLLRGAVAEFFVGERQQMFARRKDQAALLSRSDVLAVGGNPQHDRREHGYPARKDRDVERLGLAGDHAHAPDHLTTGRHERQEGAARWNVQPERGGP